ncbi:hypothetical protein [Micromonospora humi]|uniref:hypothetical protein n=1 Tax=Micromonospora humi TaxID=745366 RepID=UPI001112F747|nr:hypothetical protein [Micromonospora humi]
MSNEADDPPPTKWQRAMALLMTIKPALEAASLVAAVIGVILLVVQTSQMTKQTEALREDLDQSARQEVFGRTLDAGQVVMQNPLLFRQIRAPAGDPEAVKLKAAIAKNPESVETHRAYQLANFFIDFYDYILSGYPIDQYPALNAPAEDESFVAWSNTIRDFFTSGSLACSQFISNQASYGTSYVERVRGAGLCPGL